MRFSSALFITLALAVSACKRSGYDQSLMAKLTAKDQKVVGKYNLEKTQEGVQDPQMKQFAEMMSEMEGPTSLECFPDRTYVMRMSETEVKGTWRTQGSFVDLMVSTVGGKKPEEVGTAKDKLHQFSVFDMSSSQRDEFMADFINAMVLDRAQSLGHLRVGVDGKSLYSVEGSKDSLFGSTTSVFKPEPQK